MKHVIEIPDWRPTTLNQLLRVHWAKRSRMKEADRQIIKLYAMEAGIAPAKGKRRVRMTITLSGRAKQTDADNAWKSVLDGMVHAGLLVDDSPDWVEVLPVAYIRGQQLHTRIELEDIDD